MNTKELMKLADDAYYSEDYPKAIQIYRQILEQASKNRKAKIQLEKAEFSLSLRTSTPEVPIEAVQLYKRSRSFITAGDLEQAKKLLKEAIAITQKKGSIFPKAQELLDNITNALTSQTFKDKALRELENREWAKAFEDLNTAANLDPTDENNKELLARLEALISAQSLASQLISGVKDKKKIHLFTKEIQNAIDNANNIPVLSVLQKDVISLQGQYHNQQLEKTKTVRVVAWTIISYTTAIMFFVLLTYILPQNSISLDCDISNKDIDVSVKYPYYIAHGDTEKIQLYVINNGKSAINTKVSVLFDGPAITTTGVNSNVFVYDSLNPGQQKEETINLSVIEPFSWRPDPSRYVTFHVDIDNYKYSCTPINLHIAVSPIFGMHFFILFVWSTVGISILSMLWNLIIKFLMPNSS